MSVQHFEVVSFEPWKDGVVRIRIACDEPEGRVCHTFYARQEEYDDRVKERDTHAAEVARLTAELESSEANASMLWEKATYADLEVARLRGALENLIHAAKAFQRMPDNHVGLLMLEARLEDARTALAPAARKETK